MIRWDPKRTLEYVLSLTLHTPPPILLPCSVRSWTRSLCMLVSTYSQADFYVLETTSDEIHIIDVHQLYNAASSLQHLMVVTKEFSWWSIKVNIQMSTCAFHNTMHLNNFAFKEVLSSLIY